MRSRLPVVLFCLFLLPSLADAQRGVQLTPDERQILVNKDVGDERWAITYNLDDDTVTGNVYFPSGGDPIFLWCDYVSDNGATNQTELVIELGCYSSPACYEGSTPLPSWSFLTNVTVPASFFLPPVTQGLSSASHSLRELRERARARGEVASPRALARSLLGPAGGSPQLGARLEAAQGVRVVGRGSQLTPDEKRYLVSKDVETERWAIAFNDGIGTVTGNVFVANVLADPVFLWCDYVSDDGDPTPATRQIRFSCFAAEPCPAAPCTPDQWGFVAEVVASGGFFLPTPCDDGQPPPPVTLSSAQRAFADARGLPEQFAILLATETLDASGARVPLPTPRRIETWIYNRGQLVVALFDDGFFAREDVLGPAAPIASTSLNPAQFQPGMTRAEVEGMLGPPSCEESVTVGAASLTTLRYRATASEPVRSVTLADGLLSSVVAGFAIRNDGSVSMDPCS